MQAAVMFATTGEAVFVYEFPEFVIVVAGDGQLRGIIIKMLLLL